MLKKSISIPGFNRPGIQGIHIPIPAIPNRPSKPQPCHMPRPIGIQAVRGTRKYPYKISASATRLKESADAIGAPRKDIPNGYTGVMRQTTRLRLRKSSTSQSHTKKPVEKRVKWRNDQGDPCWDCEESLGLEVPSSDGYASVRDADEARTTYLIMQLKLYAGRPHAAYLRKTPARWATSGSCLRSRRIGSILNHKVRIGLEAG